MMLISTAVVAIATLLISRATAITRATLVVEHMRRTLPLVIAALTMHGTANTLEGLLLAKKDLRSLALVYGAIGLALPLLHALIRANGYGLAGVWWLYIGFQVRR